MIILNKQKKDLLLFFSIIPYSYPPYNLRKTATELSKSYRVIFIHVPLNNIYKPIDFILGISFLFTEKNFYIFKFHQLFSNNLSFQLLRIGLFLFKIIKKQKIILYTTLLEKQKIYRYVPADIKILSFDDLYYKKQIELNKEHIRNFDSILVGSKYLLSKIKVFNHSTQISSTGYLEKRNFFQSKKYKKKLQIKNSVVFIGGISRRLDYQILYNIIINNPKLKFFFIGEIYLKKYYEIEGEDQKIFKQWTKIRRLENVKYWGHLNQKLLYKILPLFKVGIIPYKVWDINNIDDFFNMHCHPMKVYEYLMAQLPVVSTPILSISYIKKTNRLFFASNHTEFSKRIRQIIFKGEELTNTSQIQQIIYSHTLEEKIKQIKQIINSNNITKLDKI